MYSSALAHLSPYVFPASWPLRNTFCQFYRRRCQYRQNEKNDLQKARTATLQTEGLLVAKHMIQLISIKKKFFLIAAWKTHTSKTENTRTHNSVSKVLLNSESLVPSSGALLTRNGVLIRLVRVSRICTFSCWCNRIKRRKISSSAGSEMLRRKRSRYAVVVMTSSTVTWDERQSEHRGRSPSVLWDTRRSGPWPPSRQRHACPLQGCTWSPRPYPHSTVPQAAPAL